jgi:rhodanese-related sulfurtransferase
VQEIDVHTLAARLTEPRPPAVVDVREEHEFAAGHVPGARNIPLSQLVDRVQEVLTLPGEVLLVCESGGRSAQVAAWLGQQGHDVTNVAGGTSAWRARGFPVDHPGA